LCKKCIETTIQRGDKNNVLIKRINDKNRNSIKKIFLKKNLLKIYKEKKIKRPIIIIKNNKEIYYKPIYIKKVCLKCHGSHLSPAVKKILNKFYPNDKAIQYKEGDFRWFIVIERKI